MNSEFSLSFLEVDMKALDIIALLLVIVGGINWGLVGVFDYNAVDAIFGAYSAVSNIIYAIVGLAALWTISTLFRTAAGRPAEAHAARPFERATTAAERQRETVPPSEPAGRR